MMLLHYSSKLLFSLLILIQLLQSHGQTNQTCDSKVDTITSAEIRKDAPGIALKKVTKNGSPVEYTVAEFDHLDQTIKTFLGTFKHVLFIAVTLGPHGALAGAASNYVATFSNIILDTYIRQRASKSVNLIKNFLLGKNLFKINKKRSELHVTTFKVYI